MTDNTTKSSALQSQAETAVQLLDDWFDPIEAGLRDRVREFIQTMIEAELEAALSRPRYARRPITPDESGGGPFMKTAGWGRIINISGGNARNAGNLSGGARNAGLVHMTKTLAVQLGRHGVTVNYIHPGTTRTERTPSLLAARAVQLGVSPEDAERQDFAPDSPRGNAICRMVDASEVAFVAVFLASEKAWAVSGELVAASGGAGRSVYY
jgi:NAD(P)-dependent dehydrogenase (short-subunit alcohol dehydrogenase family)